MARVTGLRRLAAGGLAAVALVGVSWAGNTTAQAGVVPKIHRTAGAGSKRPVSALTATFRTPTTAGRFLILVATLNTDVNGTLEEVYDTAGNTWTRVYACVENGQTLDDEFWVAPNAASVTSVTIHDLNVETMSMTVMELTGVATTNSVEEQSRLIGLGTTSLDTYPIAPASTNDLILGVLTAHGTASQVITPTGLPWNNLKERSGKGGGTFNNLQVGWYAAPDTSDAHYTGTVPAPTNSCGTIMIFHHA
jgi:hypothetical protein